MVNKALSFIIGVMWLVGNAAAQLGPPAGGGGQDGNAWNPANWNTAYITEYDGEDVSVCWENDPILGPVERTYTRDWNDMWSWLQDAHNSTGLTKTVRYVSSGSTKITIKWTSPYPAPSRVLVLVTSTSDFFYNFSGSGTASNALGDSTVVTPGPFTTGVATGSELRYVSINGSGEGIVELDKSAYAESTGVNSMCSAHAQGFLVAIADRQVVIECDKELSYHKEVVNMDVLRVLNENLDPTHKVVDTVFSSYNNGWMNVSAFFPALWGPWQVPVVTWTPTPVTLGNLVLYTTLSDAGVIAYKDSPKTVSVNCSVTDSDSVTRTADLELRIHVAAEKKTVTSDEEQESGWVPASQVLRVDAGEATATITVTTTGVVSVTATLTASLGFGGDALKILQLQLSPTIAASLGTTASLSQAAASSFPCTPPATGYRRYWVERKGLWREQWGYYDGYDQNGFVGVGVHHLTYFRSGSRAMAELQDYEDNLVWEDHSL